MSALGVELGPFGNVNAQNFMPHDIETRLERGGDSHRPEIRAAVPVLELGLIPQATLQPTIQNLNISCQ